MNVNWGPVEQAVRNTLHVGSVLRTPRGLNKDEFKIDALDPQGLRVSKVTPYIHWDELEGILCYMNDRDGEIRTAPLQEASTLSGSLDEYLKSTKYKINTMRSSYVASILEEAGVVTINRERPHKIRLLPAFKREVPVATPRLRNSVHAVIFRGDQHFVADCLEIPVVTQGLTVDETLSNLREAVALHMEDEDLDEVGLVRNPTISVTLELETVDGAA